MQEFKDTCERCAHREVVLLPDDIDGGIVQTAMNAERMADAESRMRLHLISEHGAVL